MGLRTGAGLGRLLRDLGMTTTQIMLLLVVIVVGVIGAIALGEQHKKKSLQQAALQGLTFSDEVSTLHLVARGATEPLGQNKLSLLSRLRSFESAAEVYDYVYKKFDEAAFAKILIHQVGSAEPAEFVYHPEASDDENLARLQVLVD